MSGQSPGSRRQDTNDYDLLNNTHTQNRTRPHLQHTYSEQTLSVPASQAPPDNYPVHSFMSSPTARYNPVYGMEEGTHSRQSSFSTPTSVNFHPGSPAVSEVTAVHDYLDLNDNTTTNTPRHRFHSEVTTFNNRVIGIPSHPTSPSVDTDPTLLKPLEQNPSPTTVTKTTEPSKPTTNASEKLERASYLDGLRGLCSIGILLHHWVDSTFGDFHNPSLKTQIPLPTLWTSWTLYVFFILIGRVLVLSFLASARKGKPNLKSLASSAVRRPFRLLIPTAFVVFLQWKGCRDGWMDDATQAVYGILESRTRGKPGWCDIGNEFSDYLLYSFNFVSVFFFVLLV